jgi:hypothetical protein
MNGTRYIESKLDGNTYCKSNGKFFRHLKTHGFTLKEYYETFVSGYTPLCYCLKPVTFYSEGKYANSCGSPICVGKTVSDTRQNLPIEKKLVASENYKRAQRSKTPEQRLAEIDKKKNTYFEKFGTTWANSGVQKNKASATKLEKYGDPKFNNSVVSAEKNKNKSSAEKNQINDLRRRTNLELYGVENCFLMPGVKSKSAISNSKGREFTLPSGKIIRVRGYEDKVIIKLLENYDETEIIADDRLVEYNIPVFRYVNLNEHTALYYPDIYIPKENKIVEVKSRWWWDGNGDEKHKSRLINNLKKRQSVLAKGFMYELWLFEDSKNYRILINDSDF